MCGSPLYLSITQEFAGSAFKFIPGAWGMIEDVLELLDATKPPPPPPEDLDRVVTFIRSPYWLRNNFGLDVSVAVEGHGGAVGGSLGQEPTPSLCLPLT